MRVMMQKIFLLIFLFYISAWSHAHIFVDYKLHAVVSEKGLEGIYVNWIFDKMFASFIKGEFDVNKDNKLSKDEQLQVYKKSFKEWKIGDYFGILKLNGQKMVFPVAQKFSARLDNAKDVVEYTYYIPLNIKASEEVNSCSLHFVDPELYIDFAITDKDISLKNKASEFISVESSLKKLDYTNQTIFSLKKIK